MSESMQKGLQTGAAIVALVMLVTSLSALAVVRADNRDPSMVAADAPGGVGGGTPGGAFDGGAGGGIAGGGIDGPGGGDATGVDGGAAGTDGTAGGGGRATGGGGTTGGGDGAAAPGGNGGQGASAQQGAGGACPDLNPDEGVFCDRFLIGGTTVLSGPLAIYGEQGLRGGQAWIEHFRRNIAPAEGVRPAQLIYYDDGLDPNRTLQFTQRLVEVDKVLLIGGVTSPEAIGSYLDSVQVPMIGDIGLSPRSYSNDMIFPTAAPYEVRSDIRIATAKAAYPDLQTIAVIQEILPGVDPTPIDRGWEDAARKHGVKLAYYTSDLSSEDNTCNGFMLQALRSVGQDSSFIMLPVAAPPMLACMREAANQQAFPGRPPYQNLNNWGGGSNLQFEVDQCGRQCHGMWSAGTPFLDPRTNPHPHARQYLANMAEFAPGIDVTGFITINYYHAGLLQYEVMKQGGILNDLSRANVIRAAKDFGPFETGFGNTVQWTDAVPRVPTTCGYNVILDPEENRWVFQTEKICV